MKDHIHTHDIIVVGAGLTGLTLAHKLRQRGADVLVLERTARAGGQIHSYQREGFIYESGPNTGIISSPEVAELFDDFPELLQLARPEARKRLILKEGQFHPLPNGAWSAFSTTLFSWADKFRIFLEPWRAKGTDPDESIASLVRRRLGESYYTYAVNPFVGGIYAGDPDKLVTRHALPKLYALEANHGSFIRGAMALAKREKTERDRRASKEVFSAEGGLSSLTSALANGLSAEGRLLLGVQGLRARQLAGEAYPWQLCYTNAEGELTELRCQRLVTTIGSLELAELLTELPTPDLSPITKLRYAPVVQVALGYKAKPAIDFEAFGGLVPSLEDAHLLGVLNPSASFDRRTPEGGLLLSVFLGGMRSPQFIERSDEDIIGYITHSLARSIALETKPDFYHIFRHQRAIPQYEASTDERLALISELEQRFAGLHIAGNMLGGIGMADRISQAFSLAERLAP